MEKNIISATVHLDETTPHMHLVYIPVIHTKDKKRDFILADNEELHNTVEHLEHEYKKKSNTLDLRFENRKR